MKKIGIITFQESNNFGAMYQAYALQQVLEDLKFDVDIIDYHSKEKEEQYSNCLSKNRTFLQNINVVFSKRIYDKSRVKFQEFRNQYLKLTPEKYDKTNIIKLNDIYDYFICGSDQVWNPDNIYGDRTYFLDFVEDNKKKISYAPSIGLNSVGERDHYMLSEGISKFSGLSCRESSGIKIIKELTGRDASLTLDPTLLLKRSRWESLVDDNLTQKPYILLYNLDYLPRMVRFAKKVSRATGLQVVNPIRTVRDYKDGFVSPIWGPSEFLNGIYNANYVITNAYHGILMSIIFQKNLIVFGKKEKEKSTENRINDILNIVGLFDRKEPTSLEVLEDKIDYNDVFKKLTPYVDSSIEYLKRNLL